MRRSFSLVLMSLLGLGLLLSVPAAALDAHIACSSWHMDPPPDYSGPLSSGISCDRADGPLNWTVPATVTEARLYIRGADDPISGTGGGHVVATFELLPGS